jgi:hypothetical protein
METVGQYVKHVSTQLNDQAYGRPYIRWGRSLLLEYLNLALSEIGTYRPEAFSVPTVITLKPGTEQHAPDNTGIISVYSNADGTPIHPTDGAMSNAFAVYDICPAKPKFVRGTPVFLVKSFSVDPTNSSTFYVEPAIPVGVEVKVNAMIPGDTPRYALSDWDKSLGMPHKFDNNLVDFMMACAYRLDSESPESRANSESYLKSFFSAMGIKYKQESKYRSGYYLGDTGTGNPRAE